MSNEYLLLIIVIFLFIIAAWLQRNIGKILDEIGMIKTTVSIMEQKQRTKDLIERNWK